MTDNIDKLLRIASPALSESTPRLTEECSALAGALARELLALLWARNGFYAFEAALHVRPASDFIGELGIEEWNAPALWRSSYRGLADNLLFFAEDIFGGQFGIAAGAVHRFDPETGDRQQIATSLDAWADFVLVESRSQTGWPLAHEWQERFGPLPKGKRLVPKVPFVLGGEFEVANLDALEGVKAMRFYADLAIQLHDAPDGSQVQLRIVE
jgi:hypothetical protein